MPLTSQAEPTELWIPITNKTTGKPYSGLERCTSIDRFSEEQPEFSELLDEKMHEWVDKDPKNKIKLEEFSKEGGFQYKHDDGFTYKLVKAKDGKLFLSRSKASGFKRWGGGGGATLRTELVRTAYLEEVKTVLDTQEAQDNWKITHIGEDKKGMIFLMENQKSYSPYKAASNEEVKKEEGAKKENGSEEDTEETTEE